MTTDYTDRGPTSFPKPKDRAAWLEMRKPYVGTSEAAALLGRHEHLDLSRYAVRKLSGLDLPETKAMRRGRTLEDGVARMWEDEDREHRVLTPCTKVWIRGPIFATPDFEGFTDDVVVETKTTRFIVDEPLDAWRIQCYGQGWAMGRRYIQIAALDGTMALKRFTIDCESDEAKACMEQVVKAASQFLGYVSMGMIPEGLALDEWSVKALFPKAERKSKRIDAEVMKVVAELADARSIKAAGAKREKDAKNELAGIMLDHDVLEYDGADVLTWRTEGAESTYVDTKRLAAEHPDLWASYERTSPGRRVMRNTKAGKEAADAMPWARPEKEDEEDDGW